MYQPEHPEEEGGTLRCSRTNSDEHDKPTDGELLQLKA